MNKVMDASKLDKTIVLKEYSTYDFQSDKRLLIPFMLFNKIGFFNRQRECIVEPIYDTYIGNCYSENDLIQVGIRHNYAYERKNAHPAIYTRFKYGVLNAKGDCIIEPQYSGIIIGVNTFIVRRAYGYEYDGAHALLAINGETIIPFGVYSDIEPFVNGLARCKKFVKEDNKRIELHGVIDERGVVVLECKKRFIPPFYGKYNKLNNISSLIKILIEENPLVELTDYCFSSAQEQNTATGLSCREYGTHFGEFAGSYAQDVMGFSDDVINDAFEGDPDAYWNID